MTTSGEVVENALRLIGDAWWDVDLLAAEGDGGGAQGPEQFDARRATA